MTGRPDGRARYSFVLYRPLQFLPVLFGISVITFVLVRLIPGDPARILLGTRATPSAIAAIRAQYGLDEPLWAQYFYFLKNLAHGEMGRSILYKIDVLKLIATRIEPTLALVALERAALDPDRRTDGGRRRAQPRPRRRSRGAPRLDARDRLPAVLAGADADHPLQRPPRRLPGLGLRRDPRREGSRTSRCPSLTVALSLSAVLTRSLRAAMVQALASDVATAARARGMPESIVFWRHVVPNVARADDQPPRRQHRLADRRHRRRRERLRAARHGPAAGARRSSRATTWWCRASRWCSPAPRCS